MRILFCFLLVVSTGRAAATNTLPPYEEIAKLLRAHLGGVTESNLDQATVKGLLQQLKSQVVLEDGTSSSNAAASGPVLGKSSVYDDAYACLQVARVEGEVAAKLRSAYEKLSQTNKAKIKGVVLDLRFATGSDYAAAAAAADCFLNSEEPLLNWGSGAAAATKKTNAISVPVVILVNGQTSGSAEALAAVLRDASAGLLVGGATAGRASIFTEFPLSTGEKLRIATAQVKSVNGQALTEPLKPDIGVESNLADEKAYLVDAYKDLHPVESAGDGESETNAVAGSATNRPARRRYNEAELVREQRDGVDLNAELPVKKSKDEPKVERPVVADPALARALDLLKGLAVVQRRK